MGERGDKTPTYWMTSQCWVTSINGHGLGQPMDRIGLDLTVHLLVGRVRLLCQNLTQLQCGPMHNVMAALPNIGDTLCSTP